MIARLVLALAATLIGWSAPEAFTFPAGHVEARVSLTDLAIVGDSLISRTMASYDYGQIRSSGGRGADLAGADGQTGRQVIAAMVPTILRGGWLVVELGINDIAQAVPAATFAEFVVDVADQLPDDRCLGWVLPWGRDWQTGAGTYAAAITTAVMAQPCHAVIGWVPVAAGLRVADGTHLTPAGGDRLADMIYATVGRR